jgi:hypothetical protein
MKSIIFWDMTPRSPSCCLVFFADLISSTLKMEAICSSETSVETRRTTRRHIPEDDTLLNNNNNIDFKIVKIVLCVILTRGM